MEQRGVDLGNLTCGQLLYCLKRKGIVSNDVTLRDIIFHRVDGVRYSNMGDDDYISVNGVYYYCTSPLNEIRFSGYDTEYLESQTNR